MLIAEGGPARTGMDEEDAEADWLDGVKPRLRSIGVPEEDAAAWMLSLAISKLQTHGHKHTNIRSDVMGCG